MAWTVNTHRICDSDAHESIWWFSIDDGDFFGLLQPRSHESEQEWEKRGRKFRIWFPKLRKYDLCTIVQTCNLLRNNKKALSFVSIDKHTHCRTVSLSLPVADACFFVERTLPIRIRFSLMFFLPHRYTHVSMIHFRFFLLRVYATLRACDKCCSHISISYVSFVQFRWRAAPLVADTFTCELAHSSTHTVKCTHTHKLTLFNESSKRGRYLCDTTTTVQIVFDL